MTYYVWFRNHRDDHVLAYPKASLKDCLRRALMDVPGTSGITIRECSTARRVVTIYKPSAPTSLW